MNFQEMMNRAVAKTFFLKVVCCDCKCDMGTKPCVESQHGKVSHGLCVVCADKFEKQFLAASAEAVKPTTTNSVEVGAAN